MQAILDEWQTVGLEFEPNTGFNGVHGSASPIEGLFERMNWLAADISSDVYGKVLVEAGISPGVISQWSEDPAVSFQGSMQSLFDCHEDLDVADCTQRALAICTENYDGPAERTVSC